jgi:hypothetical protein
MFLSLFGTDKRPLKASSQRAGQIRAPSLDLAIGTFELRTETYGHSRPQGIADVGHPT